MYNIINESLIIVYSICYYKILGISNILLWYYANMHKSVLLAVVASLLIASPLTIFGISEQEKSIQQIQNSVKQIADSTTQQKSKQLPTITQEKMQKEQLEKLQQLSLGVQNQENELQMMEEDPSQQESKELSIITQEKMQQEQFDKFKKLLKSVRDKQITVTQE